MNECPCCSQSLLRCVRQNKIYWFCSNCRQEMPNVTSIIKEQQKKENIAKLNRMYAVQNVTLESKS